MIKKFKRVLVANRGEIALRIIRTLQELNIESVAIFSDEDENSYYLKYADICYRLNGQNLAETYLDIPQIISIIEKTNCDAVHPGYGFLSENSFFVEALEKKKISFIGPKSSTIKLLGNKVIARKIMTKNKIACVPGSIAPISSLAKLEDEIKNVDFPIIIKAAAGGGGRGMRVVKKKEDLKNCVAECKREAKTYFNNDEVFWEKYIENPRHIEVQILADSHGHAVHFFERDCSIQRRHQKLIEEAPSSFLDKEQRKSITNIALKIAEVTQYENAGTVEFIGEEPDKMFFMEVNPRIQVEHPVSEMITGYNLIREQILCAQGLPLTMKQEQIIVRGHAIEVRINSEDPENEFIPSFGKIKDLNLPLMPFTRIDTHIYNNYQVPTSYDSMLAKVISWGQSRRDALKRMKLMLEELEINGIATTQRFHQAILNQKKFLSGDYTTHFISEEMNDFGKEKKSEPILPEDFIISLILSEIKESKKDSKMINLNLNNWNNHARTQNF
ncbi:MAG: hypothetical protein CMP11_07090 [Zetaproteobacteria bacterium]|nr:hypothetical protein [Pseudobdellovibrionaceae bacterium]